MHVLIGQVIISKFEKKKFHPPIIVVAAPKLNETEIGKRGDAWDTVVRQGSGVWLMMILSWSMI